MGVPHHGTGIAKWAKHATQFIKVASFGFSGNTNFLKALERSSPDWVRISRDFVERGRGLLIRSFYETERTGAILVVDEASAALHVPQEETFALPGSDHRTVCRFSDFENERFSLVGKAVVDLAQKSLHGEPGTGPDSVAITAQNTRFSITASQQQKNSMPNGALVFDHPSATATFFGRSDELGLLRQRLDPAKPGRKGVVLFGLAGSGKTQLSLRFIQSYRDVYSAVIWIDASSKEQALQSLEDTAETINAVWPTKDLPLTYHGKSPQKRVMSRLRSTIYNHWLLVIDSADDVGAINLPGLIPECKHGSVLVTSTRRSAAELLEKEGFGSLEVDSLDSSSASELLLSAFGGPEGVVSQHQQPGEGAILDITNELYGIPLALEHAGALLRRRIVTFNNFLERYRSHYKVLMGKRLPGASSYDKGYTVIAVISMLFSTISTESPEAARLLEVLSVLGPHKLPLSLLLKLPSKVMNVEDRVDRLASESLVGDFVDGDDTLLRLNISTLADCCLMKIEVNQTGTEEYASIHGLVCQWMVERFVSSRSWDFASVAKTLIAFIWPEHNSPFSMFKSETPFIRRSYVPVLERVMEISGTYGSIGSTGSTGSSTETRDVTFEHDVAFIYLYSDRLSQSMKLFRACVEDRIAAEGESWPSSEASLEILLGLASCFHRSGNVKEAVEVLNTSLALAERLFDTFDDRTAYISSKLKRLNERQKVNIAHHKAVVIASTEHSAAKSLPESPSSMSQETGAGQVNIPGNEIGDSRPDAETLESAAAVPGMQRIVSLFRSLVILNGSQRWGEFYDRLTSSGSFDVNLQVSSAGGVRRTLLMWLLTSSDSTGANMLLDIKRGDIDVEAEDWKGLTALDYAVENNHARTIHVLVRNFAVDINLKDRPGGQPTLRALNSASKDSFITLSELGADLDRPPDPFGWTPRFTAATYGWLPLPMPLTEFSHANANRRDPNGRTALHIAMQTNASLEHIRALLRWGVDPNAQDMNGRSVLHYACSLAGLYRSSRNFLGFLVLEVDGIDINLQDSDGMSPLMLACQTRDITSAQFLLHHARERINFELRGKLSKYDSKNRRTAQYFAIASDSLEVVRDMVLLGILDPREVDSFENRNAIAFAAGYPLVLTLDYLVGEYPEEAEGILNDQAFTVPFGKDRIRRSLDRCLESRLAGGQREAFDMDGFVDALV
ncbi:hypothetical protein QBC34DRAFT_103225 [Podospora aff. communis PSN243]|uniref:NB-ARC domain-containing protein n=1 Tax=Podospora aff. communis PSN243 TaxID=3040156 RepID=A0AAV9H4K4_9PEZI|nr:hypothetical protein QBC34DRAFT_103225 [Podospora aff. communis PSN243]